MSTIPKVPLTPENKQQQNVDYPRLTLDHGDRALILCIEPEPTFEYRHILEAPEIGPDGKVLKEDRQKANGEPYEATKKEFIGQHLCFGDFNVVSEKGADTVNCPTCAAAKDNDAIGVAKPHYAMHVIRYSLQPGTWQLREPFNAECIAWVFSPTRLNAIIDIATEWGDLRKHDLKLGPCENKKYQKYDINVAQSAQWLSGNTEEEIEYRKQFVAQTYQKNQCEDLSALIARRVTKAQAQEDVAKVLERMEQLTNPGRNVQVPDLSGLQQSQRKDSSDKDAASLADEKVSVGNKSEEKLTSMDFADILKDL